MTDGICRIRGTDWRAECEDRDRRIEMLEEQLAEVREDRGEYDKQLRRATEHVTELEGQIEGLLEDSNIRQEVVRKLHIKCAELGDDLRTEQNMSAELRAELNSRSAAEAQSRKEGGAEYSYDKVCPQPITPAKATHASRFTPHASRSASWPSPAQLAEQCATAWLAHVFADRGRGGEICWANMPVRDRAAWIAAMRPVAELMAKRERGFTRTVEMLDRAYSKIRRMDESRKGAEAQRDRE